MRAGILYAALGQPYLDEARSSARSSRRFNQIEHVIATDQPLEAEDGIQPRRLAASGNPYADKIRAMIESPFEQTIYLDTDTYVVDEIVHLLALLDRYDMAACLTPGYRGLSDPAVPQAFYELNTGLLMWRANHRTRELLSGWLDVYLEWGAEPPFIHAGDPRGYADQPAFRRALWEHEQVSLYVLGAEYSYRTAQCGQVADRVRVLHGRQDDFERVAAIINRERRARVFPRGAFTGM